jgi:glyoxylase-like metal-dependent hydrolase (beta-lactamase superfamily II)
MDCLYEEKNIMVESTQAIPQVATFLTTGGIKIFQIPILEFPILWGNVYLVLIEEWMGKPYCVLIDTGSGFDESNLYLERGFDEISQQLGRKLRFEDLTHILITHGHIDHFGGLTYIQQHSRAKIGVHEFDLRNLTNYEERLLVVSRRLTQFLVEAGVEEEKIPQLIEEYKITKSLFHSVKVDFTYEAMGMEMGPFRILHVPGHCAGHCVIRLENILFCGDHVLLHISPHQSPEYLTLFTGLDHYLNSLETLRKWQQGIELTLAGHGHPITNINARIDEIYSIHQQRLKKVSDYLQTPRTIEEVSFHLFGDVHGYNVLLALEEAGAHIEYLYQRGLLEIHNLSIFEKPDNKMPLYYKKI